MAELYRFKGSGIVIWDSEARRARKTRSAAIKRAVEVDISAQPARGFNPYTALQVAAGNGAGILTLGIEVSSILLTGAPTLMAFIGPLALLPFAVLGHRAVYFSRLRRGKVASVTIQPVDLGELQAEPLTRKTGTDGGA